MTLVGNIQYTLIKNMHCIESCQFQIQMPFFLWQVEYRFKMDWYLHLSIASSCILLLAICIHTISILVLVKSGASVAQRELLINLSTTEICMSLSATINLILSAGGHYKDTNTIWFEIAYLFVGICTLFQYYTTMILLLLDRFASVHLHLRPNTVFKKKNSSNNCCLLADWNGTGSVCLLYLHKCFV